MRWKEFEVMRKSDTCISEKKIVRFKKMMKLSLVIQSIKIIKNKLSISGYFKIAIWLIKNKKKF